MSESMSDILDELAKEAYEENLSEDEKLQDFRKALKKIDEYGVSKYVDKLFECPFAPEEIKQGNLLIAPLLFVRFADGKYHYLSAYGAPHEEFTEDELPFMKEEKWIDMAIGTLQSSIITLPAFLFIYHGRRLTVVYDWSLNCSFERIFLSQELTEKFKYSIKDYWINDYGNSWIYTKWKAVVDIVKSGIKYRKLNIGKP